EEVTPIAGKFEAITIPSHSEANLDIEEFVPAETESESDADTSIQTFVVGTDIIEDVEVFLPQEDTLIGSIPVVEEETFEPIAEVDTEENYEEITIDSFTSPDEIAKPIDIEAQSSSDDGFYKEDQTDPYFDLLAEKSQEREQLQDTSTEAIDTEPSPNKDVFEDEEQSDSYFNILAETTKELDQLEYRSSSIEIKDTVDEVISEDEDLAVSSVDSSTTELENTTLPIDIESEDPINEIEQDISNFPQQEDFASATELDYSLEDEEETLSTDELLAIPTMPAEPAHPAEMSIDLNAEAEILARFAALNSPSSESTSTIPSPPSSSEIRIATSSTGITSLSRDELASVMSEIDILLEYLPNHKIEELAHKDFYFLYLRLLDDLGI
ncbi:MAG: hypothetical protein ACRCY4_07925, partial [Brevinema sp.]